MKNKPQFWLVGRRQKLLCMLFIFVLQGFLALPGAAQDKKVTVHAQDEPLSNVLSDLSKQSDYKFFYSNNVTDVNPRVTINVSNLPLKDVLEEIFRGKDIGFQLKNKQILLFKKSQALAPSDQGGDQRRVSGIITDENGEPIIGATLLVKNTTKGTVSDTEGRFALDVPSRAVLMVKYIGYDTKEVALGNASLINIKLKESNRTLEEVVVVGYGTQKKRDLTSAIATVSGEDLANLSISNAASALQGRMSGVQITNDGSPGGTPSIRIRGTGSIYNSSPLFVVDGMIVDNINYLGPNDIENVAVLKDASASAIYGVRAANGVIIVTTKKGTKDGKLKVFASSHAGVKTPSKLLKMANGEQYVTMYNEKMSYLGSPENQVQYSTFNTSTDWFDEVLASSFTTNNDVSIQGGTEISSFNVGVNYLKEDGLIKDNKYDKLGIRANYDFKLSKYVQAGFSMVLTATKSKPYNGDLLVQAYKALPIMSPKDADGNFVDPTSLPISVGQSSNPAATQYYNHQWNNAYNGIANFYLEINLLKCLALKSTFGLNPQLNRYISFTPIYDVSSFQQNTTNSMSKSRSDNLNMSWDNTLTFEKTFNRDHNFKAMAGYTYRVQTTDGLSASATGLVDLPAINQSFLFLSLGKTDTYAIQASDYGSKEVQIAYMGRLNYDYKHKYLFNLTMRADGSSKFPNNHRWGYFPSIGLGWVLSQESFLENQKWLNFLKLRAGWGLLGNDNIPSNIYRPVIDNSDYRSVIFGSDQNSGNGALSHAATVTQSYNPDLKWETVNETNIGVEATMLSNRLTTTVDWYRRMTQDAIFAITSLGSAGMDSNGTWGNYADILNTGIEVNLGWQDKVNDKLSYNLNANFTYNQNKMHKISAAGASYYDQKFSDTPNITRTTVGNSIGEFFGYKAIGVFQNQAQIDATPALPGTIPGDLIFSDVNGDKQIDASDRTFLGNPNPPFIYGLDLGVKYADFDLNLFCQGVAGNKIFNANRMLRYQTENYDLDFYNHRWHGEGTSNSHPSAVMSNPTTPNSYYVESGSYFRLKTVQLGYTMPSLLINKIGVGKVRFYLNAENLLTLFGYNGFTPEIPSSDPLMSGVDRGVYPLSSVYSFGVNLVFKKNICMKKIFSILSLAATMMIASCAGDMDFDAYNSLPQTNFWQTQADAESSVFACYGKLSDWPFIEPTTFGPKEVASDNTAKGSSTDDQPDINRFKTFTFTPSLDAFNTFWNSRYSLINICNQAITHIPDITMDETYKKQLLGEAKFIRAWTYFELVRMFGEVVIYDGVPADAKYNIAKSPVGDVYNFILSDLEYGYANMKKTEWASESKGRVTAWAARALEAKVLMYMASGANFMEDGNAIGGKTWSDVKTVAEDVINNGPYSLYTAKGDSSFFYMFRPEGENCNESIFEVQNGASKAYGDINRCAYAVYRWVRGDNDNGGGWGLNVPTDGLVADWKARTDDAIRFHASIAFKGDLLSDGTTVGGLSELAGTNAGKEGYPPARYSMKAYVPLPDQTKLSWIYGIEQNIRLLRFADILLIDAEAKLNLGDNAGALISINKVRDRVKENPYTTADLTLQNIWNERRFELAFEDDRFFDLVRTGLAKTVLASQGFTYPKNVFYPLPQAQIDLSGGVLVQNKNYQ